MLNKYELFQQINTLWLFFWRNEKIKNIFSNFEPCIFLEKILVLDVFLNLFVSSIYLFKKYYYISNNLTQFLKFKLSIVRIIFLSFIK